MIAFDRLAILWLTPLLLLTSAQLFAAPPSHTAKIKAELKKLQSETEAIKKQTQAEQRRIERLKHKIEFLLIQNKALDQRVNKEIEHYTGKAEAASGQ